MGELANEVRCFKFWSYKLPSEEKVILEEYVDGIHFITSLAIANEVKDYHSWEIEIENKQYSKHEITIL
jgi:dimeric dUTPase (all-alpha-NTP-PPase superfamily)